jgi:hypothetical protein
MYNREMLNLQNELLDGTMPHQMNGAYFSGLSGCQACKNPKKKAEATGIIENYDAVKDCFKDNEPTYLNHANTIRKYFSPAAEKVNDFFGKKLGAAPYAKNLKVKVAKLPSQYKRAIKKTRDGLKQYLIPVGKIFGLYNPETEEHTVDPICISEMDDPERKYWENLGIGDRIPDGLPTNGHEYIHHAQNKFGIIKKAEDTLGSRARAYIEGYTSTLSDQLFGKTHVYEQEKEAFKQLVAKVGEKKALTCDFDYNDYVLPKGPMAS